MPWTKDNFSFRQTKSFLKTCNINPDKFVTCSYDPKYLDEMKKILDNYIGNLWKTQSI